MDPRQWFHGSWLPSKHRTPLQDQPMTRRWLPKLSATGPATGRLPYQKEMALLRWEDFLRSFILGGWGWNVWMLHFWDFLADMILTVECLRSVLVRINTHWKHRWYQNALHMNPPSLGAMEAKDLLLEKLANPKKATRTPIQSTTVTCGGGLRFKHFYLAILCDLFGMVKWPFSMVKWPPTRVWKGRSLNHLVNINMCWCECSQSMLLYHISPLKTKCRYIILLMDEILHHLEWLKPYKWWENHHPWWCRILSINTIMTFFY